MSTSGRITPEEELEYRLVHFLCIGSMTHSETLYSVRDEGKQEAIAEDILKKIAVYTSHTREPSKKVYKLKKGRIINFL